MRAKIELCHQDNLLPEVAHLLRAYFYASENEQVYYEELCQRTKSNVSCLNERSSFSRVFAVRSREGIAGGGEVRVYQASRLSNQLLIRHDDEHFWLSKMGQELTGLCSSRFAIELAYFAVDLKSRGKGVGGAIFYDSILQTIKELNCLKCSLFTIAKGVYAGTGKGQLLREFLLDKEKRINGELDGQTIVTGVKVPRSELEEMFDFTCLDLAPRKESVGTQVLAEKWGWQKLGFSKNLSPVYGQTVYRS